MNKRLIFLALGLLFFLGCRKPASMGVVVSIGDTPGWEQRIASKLPAFGGPSVGTVCVSLPGGRLTTIGQEGTPFYIVAFVTPPNGDADYVHPQLEEIRKRVAIDSILVVQISEPSSDGAFGEDPMSLCGQAPFDMLICLDPDKIAWRTFGCPKSGTVFVINRQGLFHSVNTIFKSSTLNDIAPVLKMAHWLEQQWKSDHPEDYH